MPLQVLARQWERQNTDICKLEGQIVRAAKTDEVARWLMAIPGLGPLGATAILAAVPDARMFKNRVRFCRLARADAGARAISPSSAIALCTVC
jgi:transposase